MCIREVQDTIRDSVKVLIEQKIAALGLEAYFQIMDKEIRGINGSLIVFRGMQQYNSENIKSLEGFDVAWVEEAQTLSEVSLRLLRPTIRKDADPIAGTPDAELWFSWNPRYETDPVDAFFRGQKPPRKSVVVSINYPDNPWFPGVLRDEMEEDFENDPEMAEHVWNGGYEYISEASYYGRLIAEAVKEGRVGNFPYNPNYPVRTSWDLGIHDYTSIWFIQDYDGFHNVIDYYETSGDGFDDIMSVAFPELFLPPVMDRWKNHKPPKEPERGYRIAPDNFAEHFLPHDVKVREQGSSGRHRYEILQELGIPARYLLKGVASGDDEKIQAVRRLLPNCRFHQTKRVMVGVNRLRRYSRKLNVQMNTYQGVKHDENSHGADAFAEYALNRGADFVPKPKKVKPTELVYVADPVTGALTSNMSVREIIEMKQRKKRVA